MHPRSLTTGLKEPGPPPKFPHVGDEFVWIGRIHHKLPNSCLFINIKNLFPRFPTINGFENAPLFSISPCWTLSTYIYNVRIPRIQDDTMNIPCLPKPHIFPIFATI